MGALKYTTKLLHDLKKLCKNSVVIRYSVKRVISEKGYAAMKYIVDRELSQWNSFSSIKLKVALECWK